MLYISYFIPLVSHYYICLDKDDQEQEDDEEKENTVSENTGNYGITISNKCNISHKVNQVHTHREPGNCYSLDSYLIHLC